MAYSYKFVQHEINFGSNVCLWDKSASIEDSNNIDWSTNDDLEIQEDTTFSSLSTLTTYGVEHSSYSLYRSYY